MKKEFILKILILFAFIQCTSQVSNSSKTDNNILTIEGNNIWIREYPSTGDVLFKLNNGSICKVLKKDKRAVFCQRSNRMRKTVNQIKKMSVF